MPVITLVRHAESTVNDCATRQRLVPTQAVEGHTQHVGLTARGVEQAHQLAARLPCVGAAIVSPYERARQTAAAYIHHFGARPQQAAPFSQLVVREAPVQEYTLLAAGKCAGLDVAQRGALVRAHMQASLANPELVDDPTDPWCESLAAFCRRAHAQLHALLQLQQDCIVFSHGNFIKALLWHALLESRAADLVGAAVGTPTACWQLWAFLQSLDLPNCGSITLTTHKGRVVSVSPVCGNV